MSDSHPVDVYVGKRLRLRRTILGLSQESVGNSIGISFQQIQKYERGINRMGASRLHDFAKILKVNVGYFFDGYAEGSDDLAGMIPMGMAENDASGFQHEAPVGISNRETMDIMRSYYRIKSPAVRKRILELIKSVADDQVDEKTSISA